MKRFLSLAAAILLTLSCQHAGTGPAASRLTGLVIETGTGLPVQDAFVYAYRDATTHFFGPPNHLSPPTGADGRYELELAPGRYFVFARKRVSGSYQGPLYKDDWFGEPTGKQIDVPRGGGTLDLTIQRLEGQQFHRPEKVAATTDTVISGRILDSENRPVMGAMAFAYRDRFQKRLPPNYGSLGTDATGRYRIYLDQGGEFVVGGRMRPKDPPEKGEPLGFWKNDRTSILKVTTGTTVDNVDIVLTPFSGSPEVRQPGIPR